jgi:hypothetical protein
MPHWHFEIEHFMLHARKQVSVSMGLIVVVPPAGMGYTIIVNIFFLVVLQVPSQGFCCVVVYVAEITCVD